MGFPEFKLDTLLMSIREAAELILKATYGYTTKADGADPLVDLVDEVMNLFSQACVSGKWAVDIFPTLKQLPGWFPGTGWQQTARTWNKTMTDTTNVPFEYAKLPQNQHVQQAVLRDVQSHYTHHVVRKYSIVNRIVAVSIQYGRIQP